LKRLVWRILAGAGIVLGAFAVAAVAVAATASKQVLSLIGYAAAEERLVTGVLVTGTPDTPVLYITSSDPRMGVDTVDTNSGVVSRLTWTGSEWQRVDLVRGLPRSRADHATNGMALSPGGGTLYVAQGSNTNMGGLGSRFRFLPEYALSGAILAVDLRRIGSQTYDLPTLDDDSRAGVRDGNDPFGGSGGKNQARLMPDGPVQVYAPGYRNPYDVLVTTKGRLYTIQNGPGAGWGGLPRGEGPEGQCSHEPQDDGEQVRDTLHLIARPGAYGGHPNPTRGSRANTFNRDRQSPVPRANPIECDYLPPTERGALTTFPFSTNGLAEYTAFSLGGAMLGDLLTVGFNGRLYRLRLNEAGDALVRKDALLKLVIPLDVAAQGDNTVFPGTIWVADYAAKSKTETASDVGAITVLEPRDFTRRRSWRELAPTGPERQEVSYVQLGAKLYLAGGDTRHQVYDPSTNSWREVAPLPERLDHIQGVALAGRIYYVGGLESWPRPQASSVFVYDPETDTFSRGASMPRGRGAGGVAVFGGKIYYAGGLHDGLAVPWFDVYDPDADRWAQLPDMPRPRDHFQAVVEGGRLYAIGGRQVELGTELVENDAYSFASASWTTGLAPLPTPRGGFAAAIVGHEILVIGGEIAGSALGTVEAYNPRTDTWRTLDPMPTARHGIQAAVCDGGVFVAAGGLTAGGGSPSAAHEVYVARGSSACGAARSRVDPTPLPSELANAFVHSALVGARLDRPTSLQFGPDGRLYISQQNGTIKIYTVARRGTNQYAVTSEETLNAIRSIPNHDDDGSSATEFSDLVEAIWNRVGP
jgi:glucose/arabinose dehydrogenase